MKNCPICNRKIVEDKKWCKDCLYKFQEYNQYQTINIAEWAANRARKFEREKAEVLMDEILRLREGIECHVARPGEGTYECNVNDPCPACRLRQAEEILGKRKKEVGKLIRSEKIPKEE